CPSVGGGARRVKVVPAGVRSGTSSGAGVRLVVAVAQAVGGHVGVNLRGAQAAVAEQLLHAADVGPAVEQVRGEAVPQAVRAGARVEARLGQVLGQLAADAARRQPRAVLVEEQGVAPLAPLRQRAAGG